MLASDSSGNTDHVKRNWSEEGTALAVVYIA